MHAHTEKISSIIQETFGPRQQKGNSHKAFNTEETMKHEEVLIPAPAQSNNLKPYNNQLKVKDGHCQDMPRLFKIQFFAL